MVNKFYFSIFLIIILLFYIKCIFSDNMKNSKISFKEIFKNIDYLKTYKNKINIKDSFIFFGCPILISIISIFILEIKINFNNSLTLIVSIISSILLNFWIILLTVKDKIEQEKYIHLVSLSTNIVLEIFISIILILLLVFKDFKLDFLISKDFFEFQIIIIKIIKTIYLFLILFYMINFLMILQRIFLISNYKKQKERKNEQKWKNLCGRNWTWEKGRYDF